MSIIKILPDYLINQIAAGEVVERPASVVKELVENAIDADASRIEIHVKSAGKEEIQVIDNGIGMTPEDALLSLKPHSTSKIQSLDDLINIQTLGFRGEALASIASVSKMTLETRARGCEGGTKLTFIGEKIMESSDCGIPSGTSLQVRELFFNTPARKKYLKSDATELSHIIGTVTEMALSFPGIHFRLTHNGRAIFEFPKTENLMNRIRLLSGRDIADDLIPVFYGGTECAIDGFVGKPNIARNTRASQYLFVNERSIRNNALAYAVSEGFHSLLPRGKYPVFFVYLTVKPEKIDVNVHPRKLEIRFQNQEEIFTIVKKAVKKSLETHVLTPNFSLFQSPDRGKNTRSDSVILQKENVTVAQALNFTKELARDSTSFDSKKIIAKSFEDAQSLAPSTQSFDPPAQSLQSSAQTLELDEKSHFSDQSFSQAGENVKLAECPAEGAFIENENTITPIAQVASSYIIAREHKGIVIIDQHAAHERSQYEKLMKAFAESKGEAVVSQQLLVPCTIELSHREVHILEENREILQKIGFEMEFFAGNTLNVNAVPASLEGADIMEVILGVIGDLMKGETEKSLDERREKILTSMACKSAIKFGRTLTNEEQVALLRELEKLDQKYTCPHGRPTMIRFSFDELERRFGRK